MSKKYLDFASILEGKPENGGGFYIKVNSAVTLKEGEIVYVDKPADKINKLVELGFIDEAEAESRIERVPSFIKYTLTKKN